MSHFAAANGQLFDPSSSREESSAQTIDETTGQIVHELPESAILGPTRREDLVD